jgi:hypothetical protein
LSSNPRFSMLNDARLAIVLAQKNGYYRPNFAGNRDLDGLNR